MAQESNWWDGFGDGLSEFGSDLIGGAGSYFDSQAAKSNADKAANENATLSQQARIAESNKQEAQAQQAGQNQKMMMYGMGGIALLIVLVVIFK